MPNDTQEKTINGVRYRHFASTNTLQRHVNGNWVNCDPQGNLLTSTSDEEDGGQSDGEHDAETGAEESDDNADEADDEATGSSIPGQNSSAQAMIEHMQQLALSSSSSHAVYQGPALDNTPPGSLLDVRKGKNRYTGAETLLQYGPPGAITEPGLLKKGVEAYALIRSVGEAGQDLDPGL